MPMPTELPHRVETRTHETSTRRSRTDSVVLQTGDYISRTVYHEPGLDVTGFHWSTREPYNPKVHEVLRRVMRKYCPPDENITIILADPPQRMVGRPDTITGRLHGKYERVSRAMHEPYLTSFYWSSALILPTIVTDGRRPQEYVDLTTNEVGYERNGRIDGRELSRMINETGSFTVKRAAPMALEILGELSRAPQPHPPGGKAG
ncbi:hypothetical protein BH09PAT3_BH09PAT3_3820 [soil metagenome]